MVSQSPSPPRRSASDTLGLKCTDAHDRRQYHVPKSKREVFTRHVFPVSQAPYPPGMVEGLDVQYAMFQLTQHNACIRVQYHAGLEALLFQEARHIAEPPGGSPSVAGTSASRYERELKDTYEALMEGEAAVRKVDLEAVRARKLGQSNEFDLELALCRAAFNHLGEPINTFCEDSDNFEDLSPSFARTGWQWTDYDEGLVLAPKEWTGRFRGALRAVCHWKLNVTVEDMESIRTGGAGVSPESWSHALHPGCYVSPDHGGRIGCSDKRVGADAALACVLVGSNHHHLG